MSITPLGGKRSLVSRPGFQYAEGGWAVMDGAHLSQSSVPIDVYLQAGLEMQAQHKTVNR